MANLNGESSEIRSDIQAQNIFTHPSESYFLFEGRLTKADGTDYALADNVALTNNGLMYLFNSIKYELSGQELEKLNHPVQATTVLGLLLKYPDDFSKSQGLNQLWHKDTTVEANPGNNKGSGGRRAYLIRSPDPRGTFSFVVPHRHIFGFCEDYNKIIYGMKQTLTLVRTSDNNAIFRAAGVDAGKVTLNEIYWYMPHVMPADQNKLQLYKTIESKVSLPVLFRAKQCDSISVNQATRFTWRLSVKFSPDVPRFIIIGFQTDKEGNQEQNPAIFGHVRVTNIHATLNSRRYPEADYNLSFTRQQFSRTYGDAAAFRSKFYRMDKLVSNPNITPDEYRKLFPLFVFDDTKQRETKICHHRHTS